MSDKKLKIYNPNDSSDDGDLKKGGAERVWWACRVSPEKEEQLKKLEQRNAESELKRRGIPIVGDVD